MTEKMKKTEDEDVKARYVVDPVAFALALVAAPVLVALLGFWALGIPVFALILGGPFYLVFGTPILLIYLHYRRGTSCGAAWLAFLTVALGMAGIALADLFGNPLFDADSVLNMATFGLFFGPVWAAIFSGLYNCWRNDLSRRPLPAHI